MTGSTLRQPAKPRERKRRHQLLYLYGITRADTPAPECEGIEEGSSLFTLTCGDVAGMVSWVSPEGFGPQAVEEWSEDLGCLARLASLHQGVVEAILERGAVLPARLATIYPDRVRLRASLRADQNRLLVSLDLLDGKVEWGLKVFWRLNAEPPAAGDSEGRGTGGAGRAFLRRRAKAWDDARRRRGQVEAALRELREELEALSPYHAYPSALDASNGGRGAELVLSAAILLPRGEEAAYLEWCRTSTGRWKDLGLVCIPSGPWPPYNFVEVERGCSQ